MKVIRAQHFGMCFGVKDAIRLAFAQSLSEPVTILGDLVHNETVIATLRARGLQIVQDVSQAKTRRVMVTAHGASDRAIAGVREQGHEVTDATCPLVHLAHRAIRELVQAGFYPVIVGKRDHVEVRGMTGDLDAFDVILHDEDVEMLPERPRFGIAAQTTQPFDRVTRLVELVRRRFPQSEVRFVDTVCKPTKQRQAAAVELAREADVVVVIGGLASNNTRELVQTCARHCSRVHHVRSAADLRPEWFRETDLVGLTAGTSTPDTLVEEVDQWLATLAVEVPGPVALTRLPAAVGFRAPETHL